MGSFNNSSHEDFWKPSSSSGMRRSRGYSGGGGGGIIVLIMSIIVAIIDIVVIVRYLAAPSWARDLVGGARYVFPYYLRYAVLEWVIVAVVLAVITYLINGLALEAYDRDDQYSRVGNVINRYAGGLAAVFLIIALFFAKTIV